MLDILCQLCYRGPFWCLWVVPEVEFDLLSPSGAEQLQFVHEQVDAFIREHAGTCEDVEILRSEQNCSLMFVCGTCHPELLAQVVKLLEVDPFKPPRILQRQA